MCVSHLFDGVALDALLEVAQLLALLPTRYQLGTWTLLYSLGQHGASLQTLHRKVDSARATLVMLRTSDGCVFGGFSSDSWKTRSGYFGSAEAFVYQCRGATIEKFGWSGSNTFFLTSASNGMGMGGGTGFAWWIDANLSTGTSNGCSTFASPRFSNDELFEVVQVEVWGMKT
jgi:hypothetical protein